MTTSHALEGVWRRKANTFDKIFRTNVAGRANQDQGLIISRALCLLSPRCSPLRALSSKDGVGLPLSHHTVPPASGLGLSAAGTQLHGSRLGLSVSRQDLVAPACADSPSEGDGEGGSSKILGTAGACSSDGTKKSNSEISDVKVRCF